MGNGTNVTNPFKVGDVVYHPRWGQGNVIKVDSGQTYVVLSRFPRTQEWIPYEELSFNPWPKPCHERPIEDGWWIVKVDDTPRLVEHKKGNLFNEWGASVERNLENYEFKKYLGKDL